MLSLSLYLAGFRLLQNALVGALRDFYLIETDYRTEVASRDTDSFTASCLWFADAGVLSRKQVQRLLAIRQHHDAMSGDPVSFLSAGCVSTAAAELADMRNLLSLVGRYWCRVWSDIDPGFDGSEVQERSLQSGASVYFNYLYSTARLQPLFPASEN